MTAADVTAGGATARTAPSALRASLRVIFAVMLRDLRTRFFNHGLGYLVAVAWPLVHIVILIAVWLFFGRAQPYGDSGYVYFSVTLIPFMAWNYMSRFIMLSLLMNRPLLAFPAVKILDIVFGRAALEVLCCVCMVALLALLGAAAGLEVAPHDVVDAALAFAASLALGLGFGMIGAVISMMLPAWVTVHMLLIIVFYILSGIIFMPAELPGRLLDALSWLPTLHAVEWMRVAFFEGYPDFVLHRGYLVAWAIGAILVGLAMERAFRGRMLGG